MPKNTESLEKTLRSLRSDLVLLRESLDDAADANNVEAIKSLQVDIAAKETLIASTERRIAKARIEQTAAEKVDTRRANESSAKEIKKSLDAAADAGAKAERAFDEFVAQLVEIHRHGSDASVALKGLLQQLPEREFRHKVALVSNLSFVDDYLSGLIEDSLIRAGVFARLAPSRFLSLTRHNLPPIGEGMRKRADILVYATDKVLARANAVLES